MPQNLFLANFQKVLITGATSGLGKALAFFFAEKKIPLILTGKNGEMLQALKAALESKVSLDIISLDLTQSQERKSLLKIITEKKPNLIINNAGIGFYGNSIDLPIEESIKMIEVNIIALVEISLHSAQIMKTNHVQGMIVNISSATSFFSFPLFNVYAASKSFVNAFSLALDTEMRFFGIRVLCACPGQIVTQFRKKASRGKLQKHDRRTMSIETAVQHLWKQIQRQKRLYIFDWRYRIGVWIFRFLPNQIREKILMKSIRKRY